LIRLLIDNANKNKIYNRSREEMKKKELCGKLLKQRKIKKGDLH